MATLTKRLDPDALGASQVGSTDARLSKSRASSLYQEAFEHFHGEARAAGKHKPLTGGERVEKGPFPKVLRSRIA